LGAEGGRASVRVNARRSPGADFAERVSHTRYARLATPRQAAERLLEGAASSTFIGRWGTRGREWLARDESASRLIPVIATSQRIVLKFLRCWRFFCAPRWPRSPFHVRVLAANLAPRACSGQENASSKSNGVHSSAWRLRKIARSAGSHLKNVVRIGTTVLTSRTLSRDVSESDRIQQTSGLLEGELLS